MTNSDRKEEFKTIASIREKLNYISNFKTEGFLTQNDVINVLISGIIECYERIDQLESKS